MMARASSCLLYTSHLPVVEGVSQQQPVGYAPSYQGSEETFGLESLEVVGTYPEDGDKQPELRKKQAAQSDEDKGVEETACGPCLLVALEEEKQCHQEGGGCQVSRLSLIHISMLSNTCSVCIRDVIRQRL